MAEWFYLERLLAHRARDREKQLAAAGAFRHRHSSGERAVLSASLKGWSWRRAAQVAAFVGLALIATLAVPLAMVGAALFLGGVLGCFPG